MLLEADDSRRVTVLVRDPSRAMKHVRVTMIAGDLRIPRMGLDRDTWKVLANTVTDIVHCAADVRFNRSLEDARAINT
ncbi:MAG: SDR family oxidoreductase, partial [Acidobacteriota bacterium]|nr:SDR family oxidoreductase [Acidobacteriota bacterium]